MMNRYKVKNQYIILIALIIASCTHSKKVIETSYVHISCPLYKKQCSIPLRHFVIDYWKIVDLKRSSINLAGYIKTNKDRIDSFYSDSEIIDITLFVNFLGSDKRLIGSEVITLKFENDNNYKGYKTAPFNYDLPYSPEYVHLSFMYVAKIKLPGNELYLISNYKDFN